MHIGRRPPMVRRLTSPAVLVLLLVAASCSTPGTGSSAPDDGLSTAEVLSVWNTALTATPRPLIIVGYGSTTQVGNWEPTNGNNKQALLSRLATVAPDVSAVPTGPSHGTVKTKGNNSTVRVLDAAATAQLLITASGSPEPCEGCTPVTITDPRRTTASVSTALGPATVPAWSFGVKGSKVRLVQASVDPADLLTTVPGLPYGLGNADTTVHVESDGRLTVRWSGSPSVATAGGCGRDYRLEFVEGERAVLLQFVELSNSTDSPQACAAYAASRSATVVPPHPLGDRVLVLDRSGFVVPRV